jgi:hypothetical protein
MVSVSTWTSPEIDARIVELKQKGVSHTQIAVAICHEFKPTWVNKNMVLRRARTILGIDRGEKAANERLERKRKAEKAERAARLPKEPAPRPVNVPPPAVTLPPLASVRAQALDELVAQAQAMGFYELPRPVPPPPPAPLGNGKCTFPKWDNGAPISHEYCNERTPIGSSWCASCRAIVYHRVRAA